MPRRSFRQQYDELEARRAELCERLRMLGHKADEHPAYKGALKLLNTIYRKERHAATRGAAIGRLADRHPGKDGEHAIAGYLRTGCRRSYPLVNDCKFSGKCFRRQTRIFVMANTVFTAGSPILSTVKMMVTGRLPCWGSNSSGTDACCWPSRLCNTPVSSRQP